MEWNALNIIASGVFAISENILFLLMKKSKKKRVVSVCCVLSVFIYTAVFCFLLLNGASLKQVSLVLLLSLPAAFINARGDKEENGK